MLLEQANKKGRNSTQRQYDEKKKFDGKKKTFLFSKPGYKDEFSEGDFVYMTFLS